MWAVRFSEWLRVAHADEPLVPGDLSRDLVLFKARVDLRLSYSFAGRLNAFKVL